MAAGSPYHDGSLAPTAAESDDGKSADETMSHRSAGAASTDDTWPCAASTTAALSAAAAALPPEYHAAAIGVTGPNPLIVGGDAPKGSGLHRPCSTCRAAKVRCDRQIPCSRCRRLGTVCKPPPTVRARAPRASPRH